MKKIKSLLLICDGTEYGGISKIKLGDSYPGDYIYGFFGENITEGVLNAYLNYLSQTRIYRPLILYYEKD